jgi:cytochrome c-type biogenesis protein
MIEAGVPRLGFAFSAGVVTFFAPCAYPLLPGYVAFYLGDLEGSSPPAARLRRAAVIGGLASLGFFLVYAALAGVTAALGTRVLGDVAVLELVVGGLLVVLGTAMAAGRVTTASLHVRLPDRERSRSGYLVFGVVYAVAAAGCTAPMFVAIAGVAIGGGPVAAVLTFAAYAGGMAVLMVLVTGLVATGRGRLLDLLGSNTDRIGRAAGVLLVLAGLVQIAFYLVWTGIVRLPAPLEGILLWHFRLPA